MITLSSVLKPKNGICSEKQEKKGKCNINEANLIGRLLVITRNAEEKNCCLKAWRSDGRRPKLRKQETA